MKAITVNNIILGDAFIRGHYLVFDFKQKSVGVGTFTGSNPSDSYADRTFAVYMLLFALFGALI